MTQKHSAFSVIEKPAFFFARKRVIVFTGTEKRIMRRLYPDANIIFGATSSDEFEDEMRVTVIATGFESKAGSAPAKVETVSGGVEVGGKTGDIGDIDEIFNIFKR